MIEDLLAWNKLPSTLVVEKETIEKNKEQCVNCCARHWQSGPAQRQWYSRYRKLGSSPEVTVQPLRETSLTPSGDDMDSPHSLCQVAKGEMWLNLPHFKKNPKGSLVTKHPNRTSWERVIDFDTGSTLTLKVSAEPTKISKRTQKKTNDKDRAFAKWFKAPEHMPLRETAAYHLWKLKKNFNHIGSRWRKFRIEIHSESIRTIPSHSGIWFRTKPSYSELLQGKFSIRINSKPIRNQSE